MEILGQPSIPQKIASFGVNLSMTVGVFVNPAEQCTDVIRAQTSFVSQTNPVNLQETSDLFRKRPELASEGLEIAAKAGDVETAASLIVLYQRGENSWKVTLINRALDQSAPILARAQAGAFLVPLALCSK